MIITDQAYSLLIDLCSDQWHRSDFQIKVVTGTSTEQMDA